MKERFRADVAQRVRYGVLSFDATLQVWREDHFETCGILQLRTFEWLALREIFQEHGIEISGDTLPPHVATP